MEINRDDYYITEELRKKFSFQGYQITFLLENGYLTRIPYGRGFLYKKSDIAKFPKERVLKLMEDWRTESSKTVNEFNKKCLFCFKGWDEKSIEFCDLVERGYEAEQIINYMGISETLRPYVIDKIQYLREV